MEEIKHYRILDLLGKGGMGEVYKAFDSVLERDVAIKVMHRHLSDEESDERFMQEARTIAKLVHPNVVTVYEVGQADCGPFIVMEYIQGASITRRLNSRPPDKPENSIKLAIQLLNGLASAHKLGIVHRDIKPDNILVTDSEVVKILDFGIARLVRNSGLTVAGEILGTVEYMAPEQMLGENIDHRSDIYAVGIVLYQTLTQRVPFSGENPVAILYKVLNEEPAPPSYYNPQVRAELDQVILRAINKDKNGRWDSADAFASALEASLRSGSYRVSNVQADHEVPFESSIHEEDTASMPAGLKTLLIGRENEFKRLLTLFSQSRRGLGRTILLKGEAGVGKTALARHLRRHVELQDSWPLYGSCLYQVGLEAYLPFLDALRAFFSNDNEKLTDADRVEIQKQVHKVVPVLDEFIQSEKIDFTTSVSLVKRGAQSQDDNLFEALCQLIIILAHHRPLVFIIDNLHLADESSARLFHYLSHHAEKHPILLLGMSRTEKVELESKSGSKMVLETLARIRREGNCEQITLFPLLREDCDKLIDKVRSPALFTEEFYDLVYHETKGNPLFVLETLELLRKSGAIFCKDGAWYNKQGGLKIEVPRQAEDIFRSRLSNLSDEESEVLQVAAVWGIRFEAAALSELLEITKIKLLKILGRIEQDLQIVKSTEQGFHFVHPMLRDMLYDEIPLALRREYHSMIAKQLAVTRDGATPVPPSEMARHLREAGNHTKAAPLLYEAAQQAFKSGAFREAIRLLLDYRDSLERSGQCEGELIANADFYLKLGKSYEETGRWIESHATYQGLLQLSEKQSNIQTQVRALECLGRLNFKRGDLEQAICHYQRCLELVQEHSVGSVLGRLYNSIGSVYQQRGDLDRAEDYFMRTSELEERECDSHTKANAMVNMGIIANIRADLDLALDRYQQALKTYVAEEDHKNQARVYHNIGMAYSDKENWGESINAYQHSLQLTNNVEDQQLRGLIFLNMGKAYVHQGSVVEAKQSAEKALKLFKVMGDHLSVAEAYHVLGLVHGAKGNFSEAELFFDQSININQEREYWEGLAETYKSFGNVCQAEGYCDRARACYIRALEGFRKLNLATKQQAVLAKIENMNMEPPVAAPAAAQPSTGGDTVKIEIAPQAVS